MRWKSVAAGIITTLASLGGTTIQEEPPCNPLITFYAEGTEERRIIDGIEAMKDTLTRKYPKYSSRVDYDGRLQYYRERSNAIPEETIEDKKHYFDVYGDKEQENLEEYFGLPHKEPVFIADPKIVLERKIQQSPDKEEQLRLAERLIDGSPQAFIVKDTIYINAHTSENRRDERVSRHERVHVVQLPIYNSLGVSCSSLLEKPCSSALEGIAEYLSSLSNHMEKEEPSQKMYDELAEVILRRFTGYRNVIDSIDDTELMYRYAGNALLVAQQVRDKGDVREGIRAVLSMDVCN